MIERIIAFDTTSRNSNLDLIRWIESYLAGHGIASELFFDDEGRKANLFATIGPADRGGVMLSGHTDVVPIDGQEWTVEAFRVTPRDGRLYGRGTTDMKSFVAVVLAMVPRFQAAPLKTPIHLAFSFDEEVGCLGVRKMIAGLADRPVRPAACIVGEPTEMQVIVGHKGKLSYRCHVRGFECHSSICHTGVNAVEAAAEVIAYLKRMARRMRDQGPHDRAFDPPYTTVHTGVIQGGTALNIVPKDCWFDFEFRYLPGADPHQLLAEVRDYAETTLLPEMRAVHADTGFSWSQLSEFPGLGTADDAPVADLARALSGSNRSGKVAFGTEAGLFEAAGIPTVVCGPGSIAQAHKPDEFIAIDQVAACEAFLERLTERLSA
jgi:acetylornithine deacetylase